ncbi:hypothetical protein V5O48_019096, partial [Marasmius crinis-equi]
MPSTSAIVSRMPPQHQPEQDHPLRLGNLSDSGFEVLCDQNKPPQDVVVHRFMRGNRRRVRWELKAKPQPSPEEQAELELQNQREKRERRRFS